MLTSESSYLKFLHQIQNPNKGNRIIPLPEMIEVGSSLDGTPGYEPLYQVDLNERSIQAPKYLSVEYDHNSEAVYFVADRFYDNVDLSTMTCIVQYQNANPEPAKGGYIYLTPFVDIVTLKEDNKMIIPWVIQGPATAFAGDVVFAIKFYKTSSHIVDGEETYVYDYVLNTVPAKSKVLHGLNIEATSENYYFDSSELAGIHNRISEIEERLDEESVGIVYWTVLEDVSNVVNFEPDYPEKTINKNEVITDLIKE